MRRAVEELLAIEDDRELLRLGAVGVALTTALWDHRGRDACLQRAAEAARTAGSLQLLDTALWILSLAELTGGTPRRAGAYIDQVRELRRAIGYPAEHVVNAAYLAWVGAPRPQVEALAEAMRQAGFGGVHASAVAALAVRDLAEGHYRDAYQRLRAVDRGPVPAGHTAGVPGLRRSRGPSRSPGRGAAGGGQVDGDGGGQRVGLDPGRGPPIPRPGGARAGEPLPRGHRDPDRSPPRRRSRPGRAALRRVAAPPRSDAGRRGSS